MIASSLNQRRFERKHFRCESGIFFRGDPRPLPVHTEDIGLGGACFRSEHHVAEGTPVLLYLRLRPDSGQIECKGKVCWRENAGTDAWRFGVSFVDLLDDERAAIEEVVEGCCGNEGLLNYH